MTSVLVTGGLGYVGRELVRQLATEPQTEVHVLGNLASGAHRLDQMDRGRFTLHQCDIRDAEADPGNAVTVNLAGTVNVLDSAPPGAKFVFASTAAVYRPNAEAHVESDQEIGPIDIYGYTKLHGEQFVRYYHGQNKVRGVIVRLFNVVGPGETNPHLVPAIVKQLSAGETTLKLGNLFPQRDYIDVTDVAHGFRALSKGENSDAGPLISNLGSGQSHDVNSIVRLLGAASGHTIEVVQDPTRMRAVDRPMLKASTRKLKNITGWSPSVPLAQSMQTTWDARHLDGFG